MKNENENVIKYLQYVFRNFQEPIALVISLIVFLGFFLWPINPILKEFIPGVARFIFLLFGLLILSIFWLEFKFRYPRHKLGTIGIVLSIYSEDEKDLLVMKQDIIEKIKKNISDYSLSKTITLIVIPNHLAKKIVSSEDLKRIHKKIRGHYYIQGRFKKRSQGREKYFLELEGLVVHVPITLLESRRFSEEFRRALPQEISEDPEFQIKLIKLTSETITISAKYIIGIAALISGDPKTSIKLHENLLHELSKNTCTVQNREYVLNQVKRHLAGENMLLANQALLRGDISEYDFYLNRAKKYNLDNYDVLLSEAIVKFKKNDIMAAQQYVERAKLLAFGRQEWRYSQAFLLYWNNDFVEAFKSSKRIDEYDDINKEKISKQVIKFNIDLIKNSKLNKPQLLFWIGFLYYKCLGNLPLAYKSFLDFVNSADKNMAYPREKAGIYLEQIKKMMDVKRPNLLKSTL